MDNAIERERRDAVIARLLREQRQTVLERKLREAAAAIDADERVCGFARNRNRVGNDDAAADAMRDDEQPVDAVAGAAIAPAGDHRLNRKSTRLNSSH